MRARGTREMTRIIGGQQNTLVHPRIRLEVTAGVDAGKSVVCEEKLLQIGTQPGNTLQLNDDAVSRIHLEIRSTDEGIRVKDLASTNGTWVPSGIRITEATVPSGAVLRVGHTQLRIEALDPVQESLSPFPGFGQMIGSSPAMRAIFSLLQRVAPTDETVLITGETGTGKEVCARSIVALSRRAQRPLVIFDCGAMPPSLMESELFGHVRGAFTGAVADREGAFERANGGTIFFDEVGELPLELQTRLLRAVENRTVRRVGDSRERPLDIRIIGATNRPLEEEVNHGTFRADLYYRLSVVQVRLPPLRERTEDIGPLSLRLLQELPGLEVEPESILTETLLDQLERYRWPGNVRELRNYLRRMMLGDDTGPHLAVGKGARGRESQEAIDLSVAFREAKEGAIARFEKSYLRQLLQHTGGNISQAARLAQTDRTYLSRLLTKYDIKP